MNRDVLEKRRGVTQNIALGTKFILAHFGVIFYAYLKYIFPFVLIVPALLILFFRLFAENNTGVFWSDFNASMLNSILFFIVANAVSLLSAIVVTAAMRVYRDSEYKSLTSQAIDQEIRSVFFKQLKFIGFFLVAVSICSILLYFIWSNSSALGVLFLILFAIGFIFMASIYLMVVYAIGIEGDGIKEGLARIKRYRANNVANIVGLLIFGYFASLIVRWILSIPISIATMAFGFLSLDNMDGTMADNLSWFQIGTMIFNTITSSIAYLFLYSFLLMKYFDIKERTDDMYIREKIARIGVERESFFENEGEY